MKRIKHIFLAVCAVTFVLASCSGDDDGMQIPVPEGDYANGTFVLNEGNSNPATASVSFIGDDGVVVKDIYRKENPNADETGSYLQNLFFDDSRAFIVSGQANNVTIVDRYTFKLDTTLSGDFENPRYGAVVGDHAFVTNAAHFASDSDDNFLTVIDLNDYSTERIALNDASEKVLSYEGKLYIANGYFGVGNSIKVLNPSSNSVEKEIDLGTFEVDNGDPNKENEKVDNVPNSLQAKDGNLYVLTANAKGPNKFFTVDLATATVSDSLEIPVTIAGPKNLQIEGNTVYFTSGASVYSMQQGATTVLDEPLFTYESNSQYGVMYGFDVAKGFIYIADGGDLASDSKAYQYSLDGNLEKTYKVGVGPNGFYSNN